MAAFPQGNLTAPSLPPQTSRVSHQHHHPEVYALLYVVPEGYVSGMMSVDNSCLHGD